MTRMPGKDAIVRGIAAVTALIAVAVVTAAVRADDAGPAKKTEQLLIRAQKICPITGNKLESMGGPVKATVSKATVFLCCKGCFRKKISQKHWKTVTANLVEAQGRCPVMDKPLPEKPKSTVVEGRRIFVCCPPCTKKVEADPKKYISVVNRLLEKNLGDDD